MKVTDESVEAAAHTVRLAVWGHISPEEAAREILEAAAPHMGAGLTALADAWEARGESDMAYSKTIPDEDIAMEILTNGAQMVENARHIRNALSPTP